MNTYLIPGLGGDKRMYEGQLNKFSDTKVLEFIEPLPKESISNYAKRLAEGIDKTKPFILIGVSLGGILVQEISKFYTPEKAIIISSVKNRNELPKWIRFFKYFPLQKIIHGKAYLWAFMLLISFKTMFKRSNNVVKKLKDMAMDVNPVFVYWAVNQVINWKAPEGNFQPYHIHGSNDTLFPIKHIENVTVRVENGTHVMILTHVKIINQHLEKWLE